MRPCVGPWVKDDYVEHFSGLAGVIGYWTVWGFCIAGTSGIGSFFCGPAGMGAELLLNKLLAPPVGRGIHNLLCGK